MLNEKYKNSEARKVINVTIKAYPLINFSLSFLKNKIGRDARIGKKIKIESILFNFIRFRFYNIIIAIFRFKSKY